MDWGVIATILGAIGGPTTFVALYKWAKAQGRTELLQEQSQATILRKNGEIHELKAERDELKKVNAWLRSQIPSYQQEKSQ